MNPSTDIFIMGMIMGSGPCLSFCLPIIAPLIAGTQKEQRTEDREQRTGWLNGLKSVLVFSLSRVLAYVVLAIIAVKIGQIVIRNYYESGWGQYMYLIVGIVIILFGLFIALTEKSNFTHRLCAVARTGSLRSFQNKLHSIAILGLLIGFSPCIPLFGVLSYIALESKTIANGIFYALCFGAGTMISPLIPVGVLAGGVPDLIKWNKRSNVIIKRSNVIIKVIEIVRRGCGIYLIYIGIKLTFR
ncbi:MAG: sulfite exporter TauE/SafE family protein [Candidatus Stahlbacteria bacterium]|nr:sulfite exporter TauE/SafE family protein [Candidatus Stahlbacteria bacterium]